MRHTPRFSGRFLATGLLIAAGLSSFGCGDSATVSEPATLGSLSVSPGKLEPPFNPATTSYTVRIPFDASSTTITATPRVPGDTIRFDNQQTTSQTITLASPDDKPSVTIVVTDTGTGGSSRSYRVQVEREVEDTALSALSVSPGTLSPSTFDKNTPDYTVNNVDNAVTEVTISATKSDPTTVMEIGSVTVPSGTASGQASVRLGRPGSSTNASVVVTAPGGSTNTYTITINRGASDNNFLRSLSVSSGTTSLSLVPRFSSGSPNYTVNVASNIGNVSVTPRLDDTNASMTVNGQSTTSGTAQPITLLPAGQDTVIRIRVTAQDNSPAREYSVNVKRAALGGNKNLSALTISPGSLDFRATTLTYTVNVGSNASSVEVSATKADRNATMSQDVTAAPGTARGQATIQLGGPESTTPVLITVQAPNGDSQTYRINVVKAALGGNKNLSALTISPGSLDFRATTLTYTVNVGSNVPSVEVSATKADRNATMSQDVTAAPGTARGQATIQLGGPESTTPVLITVQAPNGDSQTYRINVVKAALGGNADLRDLTVSLGSLTPPFDSTRVETDYAVNGVSSSATAITVTATPQDSSATVEINNQGGNSRSIPLPGGPSNTDIQVRVVAPNGTPKTYSISVDQPAPAPTAPLAPTVAPDLIDADDSCITISKTDSTCDPAFPESITDNITSKTTPRFSIPTPPTGTTPKLYINGVKDVDSTFDQGNLRPSVPLSDGMYDITYTLTNDGGESKESPPMKPQLHIVSEGPSPPQT